MIGGWRYWRRADARYNPPRRDQCPLARPRCFIIVRLATRLANDVNDSLYREILGICEDAYEDAFFQLLRVVMSSSQNIDVRFLRLLYCPRDHSELRCDGSNLCCAQGHIYPVVSGIPIFLLAEKEQTIGIAME